MYGLCMNHTENVKLVREPPVAQRVRRFETIFLSIDRHRFLSIHNIFKIFDYFVTDLYN